MWKSIIANEWTIMSYVSNLIGDQSNVKYMKIERSKVKIPRLWPGLQIGGHA